jgi:hypothetical protein
MSSVTSDVCRGGVRLLYLRSCAFKYRYILYNEGGKMGEFCLLYLLCMLPFPVPLTSLRWRIMVLDTVACDCTSRRRLWPPAHNHQLALLPSS